MKMYVLTRRCDSGEFKPKVFENFLDAQKEMENHYANLKQTGDTGDIKIVNDLKMDDCCKVGFENGYVEILCIYECEVE